MYKLCGDICKNMLAAIHLQILGWRYVYQCAWGDICANVGVYRIQYPNMRGRYICTNVRVAIYVQFAWRYTCKRACGDTYKCACGDIRTNVRVAIYVQICGWRYMYKGAGSVICANVLVAIFVQKCGRRAQRRVEDCFFSGSKCIFLSSNSKFPALPSYESGTHKTICGHLPSRCVHARHFRVSLPKIRIRC